jgi:hypothetical protein
LSVVLSTVIPVPENDGVAPGSNPLPRITIERSPFWPPAPGLTEATGMLFAAFVVAKAAVASTLAATTATKTVSLTFFA